ncbi:YMGG-like glycine zipper-containing protein [Aureimonas populi]|uniref:YMGG-like glycine zipper-containing protein n=1 Tax=Aureimonas populi TaxID=1701758 RepID=A0ABW5CIA8_9HYPH|nr:YMGG-like glycine zipper-containing protein [Aureimonas populi]
MKKMMIAAVSALTLGLAGCQSVDRNVAVPAGVGALGGALVGQAIGGNTESTLIGAGVGAAAGALVGAATNRPGECVYRDGRGQRYVAACPAGY